MELSRVSTVAGCSDFSDVSSWVTSCSAVLVHLSRRHSPSLYHFCCVLLSLKTMRKLWRDVQTAQQFAGLEVWTLSGTEVTRLSTDLRITTCSNKDPASGDLNLLSGFLGRTVITKEPYEAEGHVFIHAGIPLLSEYSVVITWHAQLTCTGVSFTDW